MTRYIPALVALICFGLLAALANAAGRLEVAGDHVIQGFSPSYTRAYTKVTTPIQHAYSSHHTAIRYQCNGAGIVRQNGTGDYWSLPASTVKTDVANSRVTFTRISTAQGTRCEVEVMRGN